MAARTNTGIGVGITIALLGTATLALFVLTFIFLGQKQNAQKEKAELVASIKDFISDNERLRDDVRVLVTEAQGARKSVVGYLSENTKTVAEKVTGVKSDNAAQIVGKADKVLGSSTNLLAAVTDREAKIAALEKTLATAEAARQAALADLGSQTELTKKQKADFDAAVAAMGKDISKYKDDVDHNREELTKVKTELEAARQKERRDFEDREADLNNRLDKASADLLQAQSKIRDLQRARSRDTLKGTDEYALVDGEVVALDNGANTVYINRGRKDKVVLGMTFEVYANASAIRPNDQTGEYPRGKATIEIIKIDDDSSTCRIVRNPRGNPVVRGDVIANPIYDPNKVYAFYVYGNFDTQGNGRATPEGQNDIRAVIEQWGGKVVDSLQGDVDFVILGSKPVLPPPPPPTAPVAVVQEYIRQQRIAQQYDSLQRQAEATSIPILNQNRLYTLLGK